VKYAFDLDADGFAELARHDDDTNGFIDAGDAVYARLLAFGKDARGADVLTPLSALGIGALHLGSVATPFSVNTAANETLAVVRRSGLWIGEDLSAGTLQQLDLVVREPESRLLRARAARCATARRRRAYS
jgi:hypothetical protein